jgi:hypothetical protein
MKRIHKMNRHFFIGTNQQTMTKGWKLFSTFAQNLFEDVGHIYDPKAKQWAKSAKKMRGGIQFVSVELAIEKKQKQGEWNLFDSGGNDEFPWDFLSFDNDLYDIRPLAEAHNDEFRKLLADVSVALRYGKEAFTLEFFFKPHMFGTTSRNYMTLDVTVATHKDLVQQLPGGRTRCSPNQKRLPNTRKCTGPGVLTRAEADRALELAAKHLRKLQDDAASGPLGTFSISVGNVFYRQDE